jgi:hypothetical protein
MDAVSIIDELTCHVKIPDSVINKNEKLYIFQQNKLSGLSWAKHISENKN